MRLRATIIFLSVAVLAFCGGLWLGTDLGKEPSEVTLAAPQESDVPSVLTAASPAPTLPPKTPSSTAPAVRKEEFLLTLSGESICIYALMEDGKTELVQKTEIDTGQLRQEDYESLCRGLMVEGLEKAKSLCEDFRG